jgi:hypothetical protein
MFKKIKEFIEAFKNAYNTINVNKIDAKKAIDDYSKEVDEIVYTAESLKIIFTRLEAIYSCFPSKERQDCVIEILDLLRYGRQDDNGDFKDVCGWYELYRLKSVCVKDNLAYLKELYKEGNYNMVNVLAEEYSEQIKEFCNSYDCMI